jgi:hypothetical protein
LFVKVYFRYIFTDFKTGKAMPPFKEGKAIAAADLAGSPGKALCESSAGQFRDCGYPKTGQGARRDFP